MVGHNSALVSRKKVVSARMSREDSIAGELISVC